MSDLNFSEIGRKIQGLISANGAQNADNEADLGSKKKEAETLFDFNIADKDIDADDLYNGMVSLNNTQKSEASAPKAKAKSLTAKDSSEKTVKFSNGKTITLNDGEISKTNSDGSVEITSSDKKTVTKYNKNGVKISEVATRTVNSGKISKVDTEKFFDANGNVTKEVATAYDKAGELAYTIEDNSSPDGYPKITAHGPFGVKIQFSEDAASKLVLEKGQSAIINKDGTVEVTSSDKKTVTKYDKNGVIKKTTETEISNDKTKTVTETTYSNGKPRIKTVTSKLNNKTVGYSHTVFDTLGNISYERVKSNYENGKAGLDELKGYAKDGSINYTVKDSLLGDGYPKVTSWGNSSATIYFDSKGTKKVTIKTGGKAEIDKDGTVTVTNADGSVKRYDKEGKEIKNDVITFSNGKTLELQEGETVETGFDNYGSIMVTSADGNLKTIYNKKGLITSTTLTEILDNGEKKVVRTDYIVNNRLETTKPGTVTEIGYTKEGYTSWVAKDCGTTHTLWEYYDYDENGNASRVDVSIGDDGGSGCRVEGFSLNGAYPTISKVNNNSIEIKFSDDPNNKLVIGKGQYAELFDGGFVEFDGNGSRTWYNKEGKEVNVISVSGKIVEIKEGETSTTNRDGTVDVTSADGKTVTKYTFFKEYDSEVLNIVEKTFNESGDIAKSVEKVFVNDELRYEIEDYSDPSDYPKTILRDGGLSGARLAFSTDSSKNIKLNKGDKVLIVSDGTTVITDTSGISTTLTKSGESFLDHTLNLLTNSSQDSVTTETDAAKGITIITERTKDGFYKEVRDNYGHLIYETSISISDSTIKESTTRYHEFSNDENRPGGNGYSDYEWLGPCISASSSQIYSKEPVRRLLKKESLYCEKPSIEHIMDEYGGGSFKHEFTYGSFNRYVTYYDQDYNPKSQDVRIFHKDYISGQEYKAIQYTWSPTPTNWDNGYVLLEEPKVTMEHWRYQYSEDKENSPYMIAMLEENFIGEDIDKAGLIMSYIDENENENEPGENFIVAKFERNDDGFWKYTDGTAIDGELTPYFYHPDKTITDMYRKAIAGGYINRDHYFTDELTEYYEGYLTRLIDPLGHMNLSEDGTLDYTPYAFGDIDSIMLANTTDPKLLLINEYLSKQDRNFDILNSMNNLIDLLKPGGLICSYDLNDGPSLNDEKLCVEKVVSYNQNTNEVILEQPDGRRLTTSIYSLYDDMKNRMGALIYSDFGKIVYPEMYK